MSPVNKSRVNNSAKNATFLVIYSFVFLSLFSLLVSLFYFKIKFWITMGLFLGGVFFYTLAEYLIHRFLLHYFAGNQANRWPSQSHHFHHLFPQDEKRIDITIVPALVLAALFLYVFWLTLHVLSFSFFAGFVAGYATYHFLHYKIHTAPPPKSIFKYLWRYHHIHHHLDDKKAYGVTSPFWDFIFRTIPRINL